MKYIKNENRYGLAYLITEKNGFEKKIDFDSFHYYADTGNVARTGITAIEDEDYELLLKNEAFKKMIDEGTLHEVDGPVTTGNGNLTKELQAQKAEVKVKETELKNKDKEIADLKKQLESLSKKSNKTTAKAVKDETEDF